MDYGTYRLNLWEWLTCLGMGVLISVITAWLLYRSWYGMVLAGLWIPICVKKRKQMLLSKRNQQLILEFKDAMQSVSSSLLAGYAMENAWSVAEKEIV